MKEEIKNSELEKITEKINEVIRNKPFSGRDDEAASMRIVGNNAVFYGQFWKKTRNMKEFKPLFDYLDRNGYKYNLD